MLIYKADLGEQGAKDISKQINKTIENFTGKVTKEDFWGKRRFAYVIKHQSEGFYDIKEFDLEESNTQKLKNKLNLMQEVVRYLITQRQATEVGADASAKTAKTPQPKAKKEV